MLSDQEFRARVREIVNLKYARPTDALGSIELYLKAVALRFTLLRARVVARA